MHKYNFYYVSLSDGDAAIRVRFIQSLMYIPTPIKNTNKNQKHNEPFNPTYISLNFIMDGEKKGYFYVAKDPGIANTTVFSIAFDGTHYKKLLV